MSKAQGQFTIIDYNDALTLTGYIGSNLAKTQMFNPDNGTYNPDWTSTNLVLTPSLYIIGTTTDQITSSNVTSVKWYEGTSTTAITANDTYGLSGAKSHILTIKKTFLQDFLVKIISALLLIWMIQQVLNLTIQSVLLLQELLMVEVL